MRSLLWPTNKAVRIDKNPDSLTHDVSPDMVRSVCNWPGRGQ